MLHKLADAQWIWLLGPGGDPAGHSEDIGWLRGLLSVDVGAVEAEAREEAFDALVEEVMVVAELPGGGGDGC